MQCKMPDHYAREDFLAAHFSLSLELGFAEGDARTAVRPTFWECPNVGDPWVDLNEIGRPDRTGFAANADTRRPPYGLLTVYAGMPPLLFVLYSIRATRVREPEPDPGSSAVKVQFGIQTQEPSDWLTLDIPVRMFAAAWPVEDS